MFWLATLMLLVLGVLGAAERLVAGRPGARELLAQVKPYQGWVGLAGLVFGLYVVLDAILSVGAIKASVLAWMIYLAIGVLCVALGFLLAFALLSGLFANSSAAKQKADELYDKLAPWRPSLGVTAITTAILSVILRVLN